MGSSATLVKDERARIGGAIGPSTELIPGAVFKKGERPALAIRRVSFGLIGRRARFVPAPRIFAARQSGSAVGSRRASLITCAMITRSAQPRDGAAIGALLEAAFGEPKVVELVDRLTARGDAEISLVAIEGGEIRGHIVLSRMSAPLRALGLGPVAVAPAHQRRGIGSVLVAEALLCSQRGAFDIVFVYGNPAFYQRFGFTQALAAHFSSPYAGPDFMAFAINKSRATIGGRVDYPPAFAELRL